MNNKGYTLVELLAVIIIIGVLSTVAVFSYNGIMNNSRKKAFKDNEKTLETAAEDLITHCSSSINSPDYCVNVPEKGETVKITLDQLITSNFLNKITNPYETNNFCDGYVKVSNNSSDTKLEYKTCLICGHVKSSDCE